MQPARTKRLAYGALAAMTLGLAAMRPADACTRVLWNDNKLAVLVGRTMDWPESTQPVLTVFPRGMRRDGGRLGPATVADNARRWTSRYASLVTTIYGIGTADGLNERGLGAHVQFLQATDFGRRDPAVPAVNAALWAQYLLDNAATVTEAVAGMFAIARNVSVPFGAPYKDFGIYNTEYRTVSDLTKKRYFFELATSPNVIWMELSRFHLSAGSPVMVLDPNDIRLSGDVSGRFRKARKAPF